MKKRFVILTFALMYGNKKAYHLRGCFSSLKRDRRDHCSRRCLLLITKEFVVSGYIYHFDEDVFVFEWQQGRLSFNFKL